LTIVSHAVRHGGLALCLLLVAACRSEVTDPDPGLRAAGGGSGSDSPAVAYDPSDWDAVLATYVRGGQFQYAELKAHAEDVARFERYLAYQATAPAQRFSRADRIAFYINAYNACCIKMILDRYPVAGPMDPVFGKDGDGFFKTTKHAVAGESLSVSEIEYERLIAAHKDMRAHFAVVCADRGCMALAASAYRGSDLDRQLDLAARRFLNDPTQWSVDLGKKTVAVSKIFDWYGPKFLDDPDRPVPSGVSERYLLHWIDDPAVKALLESGGYTRSFIEWNWALNETPVGTTPYEAADLEAVLAAFVKDGRVDYAGLKADAAALARFEKYLAYQATAPVATFSWADQVAFYINAYNVCCLKMILDRWPVKGPMDPAFGKDGEAFFTGTKHPVAGESLTVSELEYDRLIARYRDMRAHFAVVCADRGCFPLRAGAWVGADLDAQLEATARRFVADPRHFAIDRAAKKVRISKIFEWYGPKFLRDPKRPVEGRRPELYLAPWLDEPSRDFLRAGDYTVEIIEWDWTVNARD